MEQMGSGNSGWERAWETRKAQSRPPTLNPRPPNYVPTRTVLVPFSISTRTTASGARSLSDSLSTK